MAIDKAGEQEDVAEAEHIASAIKELIRREKAETGQDEQDDIQLLEDALAKIEEFIGSEENEGMGDQTNTSPIAPSPAVVDTGLLTGPINGLKNFLVKKTLDQQV